MTILSAVLAVALSGPVFAQAEPEKPAEAPAAAAPAAKPETPAAAPEAKPAKAAKAEGAVGCCKPLDGVADAYKQSHDRMKEFIRQSSEQVADVERRRQDLRNQIEEKESAITKLKFESSKDSKRKAKDLANDTKSLWKELEKLDRERATLCKGISRSAAQKVRELGTDIQQALSAAQQQVVE